MGNLMGSDAAEKKVKSDNDGLTILLNTCCQKPSGGGYGPYHYR